MRSLTYKNSQGKSVQLWGDGYLFNWGDVRSHSWSYSTKYEKIRRFYRGITKKTFSVLIYSDSKNNANDLYDLMDYDVQTMSAGRLIVGKYYMTGYITEMTPTEAHTEVMKVDIEFTTDSPYWIRESEQMNYSKGDTSGGLNYPHNFPFNYVNSYSNGTLNNDSYIPCNFRMTINGYVENPTVTIAGHEYTVNTIVKEDQRLVIDSENKKIYLKGTDGTTSVFNLRDKDSYIFERIPVGENVVEWDFDTSFNVILIEERGEPRWT